MDAVDLAGAGATSASPEPQERGPSRASRQAAKAPYSLSQLILEACEACGPRRGLSLADLRKQLAEAGYPVPKRNSRLRRELNRLVSHGLLVRVAGPSGASGCFRARRQTRRAGQAEPEGETARGREEHPRSATEDPEEEEAAAREQAQECAEGKESCSQPREEEAAS